MRLVIDNIVRVLQLSNGDFAFVWFGTVAVAASFASRQLAGPLLLASAEHVADCPRCLRTILDGPRNAPVDVPAPRRPKTATTIAFVVAMVILALLLLSLA